MPSCTCAHTDTQTHHNIVSLHLSFLTGQFLTLQLQTAQRKKNVMSACARSKSGKKTQMLKSKTKGIICDVTSPHAERSSNKLAKGEIRRPQAFKEEHPVTNEHF